jgi:GNAT superfamily N-acetyltransferase
VTIRIAESDEEIARCFPVVSQLRPHLTETEFVPTVRRQEKGGYRLVSLEEDGRISAVAGYRLIDNLFAGRVLYVDDLVTDADARSKGYGKELLSWLANRAREEGCKSLELDSGVQRFDAHRFYLGQRMFISSHHFRLELA